MQLRRKNRGGRLWLGIYAAGEVSGFQNHFPCSIQLTKTMKVMLVASGFLIKVGEIICQNNLFAFIVPRVLDPKETTLCSIKVTEFIQKF